MEKKILKKLIKWLKKNVDATKIDMLHLVTASSQSLLLLLLLFGG